MISEHQQDIRCKAPSSDNRGVSCNTPQGGANEGNAADDVLMVHQKRCRLHRSKVSDRFNRVKGVVVRLGIGGDKGCFLFQNPF